MSENVVRARNGYLVLCFENQSVEWVADADEAREVIAFNIENSDGAFTQDDFVAVRFGSAAAAPDLLAALKAMTNATEMLGPPALRDARDAAFRAIAKAEGGTQ